MNNIEPKDMSRKELANLYRIHTVTLRRWLDNMQDELIKNGFAEFVLQMPNLRKRKKRYEKTKRRLPKKLVLLVFLRYGTPKN